MFRSSLVAGAMLVLLMASPASAQFRGLKIPASALNLFMLRGEAVQKELKLDDDQVKSINELASQMQSEAMEIMSGLQDLTPEEQKKEIPSLMKMVAEKGKVIQDKVDKVLKPEQAKRVNELSIQRRGLEALQDDQVIAALKLSDDQKQKLTAAREEMENKQDEAFKDAGGDRAQIREKIMAVRKEGGEKAMAILTTEQREQFEKMKGAKFEFPPQRGPF